MAIIKKEEANPIITAIDEAAKRMGDSQPRRGHLGASSIGRECRRSLFFDFRWCSAPDFSGRMYRLFERGQSEEERFVRLLKSINVSIEEIDPRTGKQYRFSDISGHFCGSMDGEASDIAGYGDEVFVVEMKTHGDKSFRLLKKDGVRKSKPEHFAQVQVYMQKSFLDKCLYLAVNKNDDSLYVEIIKADSAVATALTLKAEQIITAETLPARISDDPSFYKCKWCDHVGVCHQGTVPLVNCRTCAHVRPLYDGEGSWICDHFNVTLATAIQEQGSQCPQHRFNPELMPWKAVEASVEENWVAYERNGASFRNGAPGKGSFSSAELAITPDVSILLDEDLSNLRVALDARIVE